MPLGNWNQPHIKAGNNDYARKVKLAKKRAKNQGHSVMQSQHVDWGRQGRLMEEAMAAKKEAEAKKAAEAEAAPQNWPKTFSLRGGRRRRRKTKRKGSKKRRSRRSRKTRMRR